MEDYKSLLASKTVWASLLGILSIVLGALGYNFGTEEIQATSALLAGLGSTVCSLVAIYGRVKATKKIGKE